jgi:hypothetical protein
MELVFPPNPRERGGRLFPSKLDEPRPEAEGGQGSDWGDYVGTSLRADAAAPDRWVGLPHVPAHLRYAAFLRSWESETGVGFLAHSDPAFTTLRTTIHPSAAEEPAEPWGDNELTKGSTETSRNEDDRRWSLWRSEQGKLDRP